jgi:acyl carrier protein
MNSAQSTFGRANDDQAIRAHRFDFAEATRRYAETSIANWVAVRFLLIDVTGSKGEPMNDPLADIVRRAVAEHLDVEPGGIQAAHRFARDLELHPLDVVLIALRLEEVEGVELPIDRLDSVETVAELTKLLRRVLAGTRHQVRSPTVRHRRERQGPRRASSWWFQEE